MLSQSSPSNLSKTTTNTTMTRVPIANSIVPLDVPPRTVLPRPTVPPRTVLLRPDLLRPKKFRTLSSPSLYPFRFVLYKKKELSLPIRGRVVRTRTSSVRRPYLEASLTADREKATTPSEGTTD